MKDLAGSALDHAQGLDRDRAEQYQEDIQKISKTLHSGKMLEEVLKRFIQAVSAKNKDISGHSERVADYAASIGKALAMTEEQLVTLRSAALLHDIGKIHIPEDILNKKGKLTEEEFELIKMHPVYSADIVRELPKIGNIIEDIRLHHERYDGCGYPEGIGGTEIPIGARILAIADAFDAMQSDRPYRKAMSLKESVQELEDNSGTQFDPGLVALFIDQFDYGCPIKKQAETCQDR